MPDQHGLGDNGTESTRPRQSGKGDDQMNEYDCEVDIPAMVSRPQNYRTQANLEIRHRQVYGRHNDKVLATRSRSALSLDDQQPFR
jgi:hypothetical protein